MEKKKCKGCKNKPLLNLNKEKIKEEDNYPPIVKVAIFIYTLLAIYGTISLFLDLKMLFKQLF
jgi:hypothetical protein